MAALRDRESKEQQARWNQRRLGKSIMLTLALLAILFITVPGEWMLTHAQESPLATPVADQQSPLETPASDIAIAALPSINGVVRNDSGEVLSGMLVTIYRRQQNNWLVARQAITNDAGEYRFPWMAAATYRLLIRDPQGLYATTFYPTAADIEAGSDVVIIGSSISDVDPTLAPGGSITGTLTWPDGPTPFNSTLELYYVTDAPITTRFNLSDDLTRAPELRNYRLVASQNFTDSVVNYSFTGLAAGSYRVCGEAVSLRALQHECFDNAALGIHATDVVVATGATVADVAIELGDGADFSTLVGTVTLADSTPAVGVDVEIVPAPNVDFSAAPPPQRTTTNESGMFSFGEVPFGRYTIRFTDADGLFLSSDYRATPEETQATEIAVERNEEISISAIISAASLITGHVTLEGIPAGMNGQVTAFTLGENGWMNGGAGTIVAASGAYTVTGLRGGDYRLQYTLADLPTTSIFYGQPGATLETATDITVITGTTVGGIDIDLTPYTAGIPFGSISGQALVEGAPQADLLVRIFDAAFDCCITPPAFITVRTDAEGRFSVAGLPAGRYKVGVSRADQPLPTLFAPDQPAFETAATFTIGNAADGVSSQSFSDVNINLVATGDLARSVRRTDDTPVVGATVSIYPQVGESGTWPLVTTTQTNAEGQYRFSNLVPGIYQVCINTPDVDEPNCGGRNGQGIGVDVVINAGQEATGIDILNNP